MVVLMRVAGFGCLLGCICDLVGLIAWIACWV